MQRLAFHEDDWLARIAERDESDLEMEDDGRTNSQELAFGRLLVWTWSE